ncbi:MAG: hypothetical protein QM696_02395 [Steroidobacteraceae bacterium]
MVPEVVNTSRVTLVDEVPDAPGNLEHHIPLAPTSLVAVHPSLLAVQQVRQRIPVGRFPKD